jgi:psp operon transcriptional activator
MSGCFAENKKIGKIANSYYILKMTDMIPDLPPLLGESAVLQDMLAHVSRAAPLDRPVLVIGERGTGKELIAARLHFLSRRWGADYVKLNCAALAESLLETELFGHEAGAFTGAARRRAGRFELADGGTLLLDEIANASLAVQEKILRAVEYGEFERVGGNGTVRVDVRVVGATNIDLPAAAAAGDFRHDLLDRLSFDVITVPPLRARGDDILLLAGQFARAMASELGREGFAGFTDGAQQRLMAHDWPGNVRELKNTVERAVYGATDPDALLDEIGFDPFASPWRPAARKAPETAVPAPSPVPENGAPPAADLPDAAMPFDYRAVLADTEARLLAAALAANRHNQRATAAHLGLTYHQLRHALDKHGLLDKA